MTFKLDFFKPHQGVSAGGRRKSPVLTLITSIFFILLLSYLLYVPEQKTIGEYKLQVGDIVSEDITIKNDITVEDKESTEQQRREIVENAVPIFEYHHDVESQSRDMLLRWFNMIRSARKEYYKNRKELPNIKARITAEFGLDFTETELKTILQSNFFTRVDLNQLVSFIKTLYDRRIVASLTGCKRSKAGTLKMVPKTGEPRILKVEDLYDLKNAGTALARFVKEQQLTDTPPEFIASVLMEFVDVNISYSSNLTSEEAQRLSASINPVLIRLKANKIILRKGDEVSPEAMKILRLIALAEKTREQKIPPFVLIFVILGILTFFGVKFFKVWQSGTINKEKIFTVMASTLLVSALVYRVSRFLFPLILKNLSIDVPYDMQSIFLAIPFGFGVLAMAFIFNLQNAVIYSFVNAIIGGIVCNWDFRIVIYILLGNLAVAFAIEFYQRLKRSPIIKAAILWLLPVNLLLILVFNFTQPDMSLQHLSVDIVMGAVSAIISPILATFIIPLWETIFNLVTELKLIELTNLNLPIFREMLEKAPGTYHHSQMVASLAEAAAQDLGRSPLLQTSMALYHDIGKIDNPHFFTENHSLYKNPHKQLSPQDSAKNITSHIQDGMERAEKLKLPPVVSSSIRQHHGTKVVRFFYDKAREMSSVDSDDFEDKAFRYQGEKPKNIENAIIMLADQVEAASKSLASPTEEEIKNVIRQIIENNIEENQFDECDDLTFKALSMIANSFHKKLSSIYHMRVSYPGFDFKEKEKEEGE